MNVQEVKLIHFRNYAEQTISIASGTNVFVGSNAQGKTNILEAIYLCTCARSHRTGRDSELILHGQNGYQVGLSFTASRGQKETIEIDYSQEPKISREIRHCGLKLDRLSDLLGLFHAVIFAPEDVMLVKEGPGGRRRFLDLLISQLSPSYFRDLQLYQKYLTQRNHLLKNVRREPEWSQQTSAKSEAEQDPSGRFGLFGDLNPYHFNLLNLKTWSEQLAACGARIIQTRQKFAVRIETLAKQAIATLSDDCESFSLTYRTVTGVDPSADLDVIAQQLIKRLERTQEDDIKRGSTGSGPHRDDLEFCLNDAMIKAFASQGQQRSVVLALKLAELAIIEEETGEKPVLLLDDVMSELDAKRRTHLLSAIEDHQVFITCTDLSQIFPHAGDRAIASEEAEMLDITFFKVDKGTVIQQNLV